MRELKRQHTIEYSFVRAAADTVFLSILSLACFYAALWMAQDIFPDWQISAAAKAWLAVLVVLTAAVYEIGIKALPRRLQQWVCRLLAPCVYGILFYRYVKLMRIDFEDGACAFAVQFLEKFNRQLKTSFLIWKGKQELLGMSLAVCLIGIALALLILALISGRRIFLLLLPALVLAAELLVGYTPQWKGVSLFFAGVLLAFAGEGDSRRIALRVHSGGQRQRYGRRLSGQLPLACFAVVLVVLAANGAVFENPAERLMQNAPQVRQFQKDTERKISNIADSIFAGWQESVNNQPPHYTGKEVIKITASRLPQTDLYLKGFYGTDYQSGRWICSKKAFAGACRQAGYTQEEAAQELLQAEYDAIVGGVAAADRQAVSSLLIKFGDWDHIRSYEAKAAETDFTIEYTGVQNKYAYLPYTIDLSQGRDKFRLSGDASVQKARGLKQSAVHGWNYTVDSAALVFVDQEASEYKELFQWYDAFADSAYLAGSNRVPSVEDFLNRLLIFEDGSALGVPLSDPGQEFTESFHALQTYMEHTDSITQRNLMRLRVAQMIKNMLKDNMSYSLNLKPLPDGMDAVEYFLAESHEGYCVHFASAAALMLRKLGIPARYASGYVARKENFEWSDDLRTVTASVKDSNAHAWVEIYLEGIGWAPVDVTPGIGQAAGSGQAGNGSGQQNTEATGTQDADLDDTNLNDTDSDNTNLDDTGLDDTKTDDTGLGETAAEDTGSDGTRVKRFGLFNGKASSYWTAAVLLCCSLLLAFLIVYFMRHAVRRYHKIPQKELRNGRYRRAVRQINYRFYQRLRLCGKIRRRSLTDAEYAKALAAAYPDAPEEDWARYMQIVKEAAFSGGEIDEEDAYFCWRIYWKYLMRH